MSTDVGLRILLSASSGNVQSVVSGIARAFGGGSGGLGAALTAFGLGAGAALVGAGIKATQMAADYQESMTQLQNTTGSTDAQMQGYAATIRSVSDATGKAQTDLAKGMYQVVSANFAGADATRILTTATKAASIAGADQATVTTGLVVTLNAFGLKANEVDSVSNRMFKTLSLGRGQMGDLAGALQTGGALVAHYGVSVTDMDAILATLSTGGMKTFGTSMTGLTQLLNVMDGKTDLMTKRIEALGSTSGKTAAYDSMEKHLKLVGGKLIEVTSLVHHHATSWKTMGIQFDETKFKAMSVTQQIAYLTQVFKGHEKQMVAVLGSKQAATALGILGTQSGLLASNLEKLGNTQELAKEKSDAWARKQQDFNFQLQQASTKVQNLMIDLGTQLLPVFSKVMDTMTPLITKFVDWFSHSKEVQVVIQDISNFIQWTFSNVLVGLVTDVTNLVTWLNNGSAPANAVKIGLEGIGVAILGIKLRGMINDMIDFGKSALDFVQNIGPKMVNMLTGSNGIAGAANTASDAEKAVGVTAKTTMATDVAEGSLAAEGSLGKVGAEATATEGEVAGASAGMKTSLLGMLPVIGTVFFGFTQLRDVIGSMKLPGGLTTDQAASAMQKGLPGGFNPWPFGHAAGGFINPGDVGLVGERGPEFISGGSRGVSVTSTSASAAILRSGSMGGGHTFNFTGDININAPGGDPRDMAKQFLDEVEREQALRFRLQTSGYASAGVF